MERRRAERVSERPPHPRFRRSLRSDWDAMENLNDGLTARQRDMLDFERTWWQLDDPREDTIRARFGCDSDEYYSELNQILELPGAMAHDPLVVRRFRRRRVRRRRSLFEANSRSGSPHQPNDGTADAPPGSLNDRSDEHQHQQGGANA